MRTCYLVIAGTAVLDVQAQYPVVNVDVPQAFALCYESALDTGVTFQGTGPSSVWLHICAGQMEACCDHLVIFDGSDLDAPILFDGPGSGGDLTDMFFASSSPDIALTCRILTNDSIDCWSEGYIPIVWSVGMGQAYPCDVAIEQVRTASGLVIFPDPAQDFFTVRMDRPLSSSTLVSIFDVMGRPMSSARILEVGATSTEWDVSAIPNGQYVLVQRSGTEVAKRRFVVLH